MKSFIFLKNRLKRLKRIDLLKKNKTRTEKSKESKHDKKHIIHKEIKKQKIIIKPTKERDSTNKIKSNGWVETGVEGLDDLLGKGLPRGTSIILAGGPGSGKTILGLQISNHAAKKGEKVLYISLEEPSNRLKEHMCDFNWNPELLEKKGFLKIIRANPFAISRNVEALLAKEKGELTIDLEEIEELIPENFKPDWIILDSVTALEAAFKDEEETYRIYVTQLFRYFEKLGVTSFLISETENIPEIYSKTGVEEFLADGVIVIYHIKKGNLRERAIEVLKLRGVAHKSKIVAMQIVSEKGIEVYPEQQIFGNIE